MKIVINTDTNLIVFALDDDCETGFTDPILDENGDPDESCLVNFKFDLGGRPVAVADLTESNTSIVNVDAVPDDFIGCKYSYDADQSDPFVLNPDWVDPTAE